MRMRADQAGRTTKGTKEMTAGESVIVLSEAYSMVRVARLEDAPAIAKIHVATWRVAYAGIVPEDFLASLSEEERIKSWQEQLADGRTVVLVAEKEGEVVGWAAGGASRDDDARGEAEVYAIYILPEHWGGGVGRELMARMEEALGHGQDITLWVLQDNQRAIGFYEKVGYRPDGAKKEIPLGGSSLLEVRLRKIKDK